MSENCLSEMVINFDFKILLNALVIIFGWWIVHILSSRRDSEKMKKESSIKVIDEAVKMLEEISLLGIKYHTTERNEIEEFDLKSKIQNFSRFIYTIEKFIGKENSILQCTTNIKKLRQAITSQHFEDEHTDKLNCSNIILNEVADIHLTFRQTLIEAKFSILKE